MTCSLEIYRSRIGAFACQPKSNIVVKYRPSVFKGTMSWKLMFLIVIGGLITNYLFTLQDISTSSRQLKYHFSMVECIEEIILSVSFLFVWLSNRQRNKQVHTERSVTSSPPVRSSKIILRLPINCMWRQAATNS